MTSRATRVVRACVVAVSVVALAAGCVLPSPRPPRYEVPDEVLLGELERIPGVVEMGVSYNDLFGYTGYQGTVVVDEATDPWCALDQVMAILRQGRDAVPIAVAVAQGEERYTAHSAGMHWDYPAWFDERYGPRPNSREFVEPTSLPACE